MFLLLSFGRKPEPTYGHTVTTEKSFHQEVALFHSELWGILTRSRLNIYTSPMAPYQFMLFFRGMSIQLENSEKSYFIGGELKSSLFPLAVLTHSAMTIFILLCEIYQHNLQYPSSLPVTAYT
jgi:hypothetical protein